MGRKLRPHNLSKLNVWNILNKKYCSIQCTALIYLKCIENNPKVIAIRKTLKEYLQPTYVLVLFIISIFLVFLLVI